MMPISRYYALHQRATQRSDPASFPFEDVRAVIAKDGVGRAEKVRAEGDLVAHRAGEDEQGGGMSGQGGDVSFEGVGGRVVAEDIVEEGGVCDGVQHGGSGSCDDVAWAGREGSVNWECEGHRIGSVKDIGSARSNGKRNGYLSTGDGHHHPLSSVRHIVLCHIANLQGERTYF